MRNKMKITAKEEQARSALVPKLRFPEFRGEESWENKLIGPYLEDCSGRVPPDTELPVYSSTREGLKRQDAYFDGRVLQNKNDYGVVPPGCLVYRHMSDDGLFKFNINETGGEIAVSKEYPVFSTKGLNSVFLLAKLNDGLDFKHFALSQKAGGTRTRLYFSRLCEWRTLLPYPAEQQKIAECLSSVDELLAAQALKVDALKTHKKGLMQQLFPREGETQPRLRFSEFQNAGEWAVRTMGGLASFSSGGTPSKDNPKYWNGSIPWVSASSMYDLVIERADYYVTPLAIGNGTRIAKKGAILILVRGSMLFKRVPICIAGVDVAFNQDVKALDVEASIDTGFLLYQLSAFQARFPINETGIGAGKIELEHLKGFELFIPDTHEQHRIASCLSRLDALITAETQKHEALKSLKKGLMQQLFPSPEEALP
jgi:type I restriction enzyme S subunit